MMRNWRNPKGITTIEIDGRPPDASELWDSVSSYGHFTAMQVRGGKARGVGLHLQRLEAANLEVFGIGLDAERVRVLVRHALGDTQDASLRVYIFETPTEPTTLVTVKPPGEMATPSASVLRDTSDRSRTSSTSRPIRGSTGSRRSATGAMTHC